MARPELGTKHTCPECEKKFYDLNNARAVCPGCGHTIATENDAPEEKEIPVAKVKSENGLKPPESGDDFDDDEAGVIDDDKDLADLGDDDKAAKSDDDTVVADDDIGGKGKGKSKAKVK